MWRVLDHTADVGLEVEAASWPELAVEATRAFGEWTSGGSPLAGPEAASRRLEVRGADRVETWVALWRSLLRLWTVEGFLATGARIQAEGEGHLLRAELTGVDAETLDPSLLVDVKAVTWHAARCEERDGHWVGSIVLDL